MPLGQPPDGLTFGATQVEQALLSAEIRLGAVRDAVESIAEKFPHLRDVLGRLSRLSEDATG